MRKLCAIAGILALSSLAFYGITGMTLWAPVTSDEDARASVLVLLHFVGLMAGIVACIDAIW